MNIRKGQTIDNNGNLEFRQWFNHQQNMNILLKQNTDKQLDNFRPQPLRSKLVEQFWEHIIGDDHRNINSIKVEAS
eukprot:5729988-Heterocapsa_arctica.AAC.1